MNTSHEPSNLTRLDRRADPSLRPTSRHLEVALCAQDAEAVVQMDRCLISCCSSRRAKLDSRATTVAILITRFY